MNNYLSCPVLACSSFFPLNPGSTHDLPRPYQIYHALRVPGVVYGIAYLELRMGLHCAMQASQ